MAQKNRGQQVFDAEVEFRQKVEIPSGKLSINGVAVTVTAAQINAMGGSTVVVDPIMEPVVEATSLALARTAFGLGAASNVQFGTVKGTVGTFDGIQTPVYLNGDSGTSKDIAWDHGSLQSINITGAVALTFTPPTSPGKLTLIVKQDGTGHVYSLPTIKWPGGVVPTYSTAANKIDIITCIYDGTNYYGMGSIAFA